MSIAWSCSSFDSVKVRVAQIHDYITHWNTDPRPFQWTATTDEILAKVRLTQTNIKRLVDNNAKKSHQNHETLANCGPFWR